MVQTFCFFGTNRTTPSCHLLPGLLRAGCNWNLRVGDLRSKKDYLGGEDELHLNLNYQLHTTFQAAYLIERIKRASEGKHSLPKAPCPPLPNLALFLRLLTSPSDYKKVSSFTKLGLL